MDKSTLDELLRKYAEGLCTQEELNLLEEWYRSFDTGKGSPFGNEEQKERIKNEMREAVHARLTEPAKTARLVRFSLFYRIAAAVLAGVLAAGAYFIFSHRGHSQEAYVTAAAMPGKILKVVLPDSSVVWLNAASAIRYPKAFEGGKREVYLQQGEALFEVKHNVQQPFIVHAGGLLTRVLGTSFDIRSYRQLNQIQITVASGAIQVSDSSSSLGVFTRNQQLDYNKQTGQYEKNTVDAGEALEWKDGMVVLNRAGFAEVALTLENLYGVKIQYSGLHAKDYRYTLSFSGRLNLQEVLDIIRGIHDMDYKIENDTVVVSAIK